MKIDILIKPEDKCDHIEQVIRAAIGNLNIRAEIKRTSNFAAYTHLSINPSQTPVVIINSNVEFAGKKLEEELELETVKRRLAEIEFL